ncbi:hypothetical protein GCM10025751_50080 [Haladaptatus pallidirubidus]|uniref:Halobacterial output domain-containing protein n=1 Tax=Haladaptatus pallidirubidus TaxID=1008152 RepID=A0AAV3UPV8_9EURY
MDGQRLEDRVEIEIVRHLFNHPAEWTTEEYLTVWLNGFVGLPIGCSPGGNTFAKITMTDSVVLRDDNERERASA